MCDEIARWWSAHGEELVRRLASARRPRRRVRTQRRADARRRRDDSEHGAESGNRSERICRLLVAELFGHGDGGLYIHHAADAADAADAAGRRNTRARPVVLFNQFFHDAFFYLPSSSPTLDRGKTLAEVRDATRDARVGISSTRDGGRIRPGQPRQLCLRPAAPPGKTKKRRRSLRLRQAARWCSPHELRS